MWFRKNYFCDVVIEGKDKREAIAALEHVHELICKSEIQNGFIIVTSYDSISEYYCNKIYPYLNRVERNLRKLLLNIYIVNLGKEYYSKTVSEGIQEKAKTVIQAPKGKKKPIHYIQKFFYSLELGDMERMLFEAHWSEYDEIKNAKIS